MNLDPGILKRIIVTVAQIRKIKVGEITGIVMETSVIEILPEHDMPYLAKLRWHGFISSPLSVVSHYESWTDLWNDASQNGGEKLGHKYGLAVFYRKIDEFIKQELENGIVQLMVRKQPYMMAKPALPIKKACLSGCWIYFETYPHDRR